MVLRPFDLESQALNVLHEPGEVVPKLHAATLG
jgi:hypothetical protein